MATYGYSVGNSTEPIPPPVLRKIHLTPSRSKFIVIGTKDSIFDWMEQHGKLVCEFHELSQEFHSMPRPRPSNRLNRTTTNTFRITSLNTDSIIITFELYGEEAHDKHDHNNIFKRLFSPGTKRYHGSSKMRLEIRALNHNDPSPSPTSTPVMEARGLNGIKLYQVLNSWKSHKTHKTSNRKLNSGQGACDYE